MITLNPKSTKSYLEEEEVLEILEQFGLAHTKRQLRYILDKGELKYKVVQVSNLVRKIRVSEASLYWYIVKQIPVMKELFPMYQKLQKSKKKDPKEQMEFDM